MMIVLGLGRRLPPRFVAEPRARLGSSIEVDVATLEEDGSGGVGVSGESDRGGGSAVAAWAPPRPTLAVSTSPPDADEYEVRVYDARRGRRLVAAVELVSPSNTDRPGHRRAFVSRCAELLRQGACVAIVDPVTTRSANLYVELLGHLGQADPAPGDEPPATCAVSCRWIRSGDSRTFEAWAHPMPVGRPMPTLPLWLLPDLAVPLGLEESDEETCRALRIPG